ncbi:hypothetical protein TW85_07495 [Marinomonas sp. S3726]|uniref:hypothetical protein n=1 Tax=Marinomonas sp. S3726 TaxID=579484 RepID=UPI0005FA20FF|nr:hypothetical protein [Marinomonas sp. S3726]KJZ14921.1 hypothetical protein TW85_07495 [Marinomonas sp. S3726]
MTIQGNRNFQPEKFKVFVRHMIQVAKEKRCVTYNELENIFGLSHAQVGYYSGALGDYCISKDLPPLNALVISSTDCTPSHGFDWYQEHYEVSWGELISNCYQAFHVTQTAQKKVQDFSGRDRDVENWLEEAESVSYLTGS